MILHLFSNSVTKLISKHNKYSELPFIKTMPNMKILKTETVGAQTVELIRRDDNRLMVLSSGVMGIFGQTFKPSKMADAVMHFGANVNRLTQYTYGGQHYE